MTSRVTRYGRMLLSLFLLWQLAWLSACGWHLRGSYSFPSVMETVYVQGVARYSELGVIIHNAFQGSNTTLVDSPAQASAVLHILADKSEQRILSTDSSSGTNEYEVSYHLSFRVLDKQGKELISGQQIRLKREYKFDANNVLASGGEVERLTKDMKNNGVQQMLRRINAGLRNKPAQVVNEQ